MDGVEPVGRGSYWLMRQDALPIPAKWQPAARAAFERRPLCICRTPVANRSGLALPALGSAKEARVLQAITEAAKGLAREQRASFVLYDYLDLETPALKKQDKRLAWMALDDPGTALPIRWTDFEQYLKERGKTAWKDYRRHANRASDLKLEITRHDRPTNLEEALPLIRSVEVHHRNPPVHYVRSVLEHLDMVDSIWLEARMEGRLVGCGLLLSDNGGMVATLLGLDYREKYVYFQIVYEAVRCAIETGARILFAGSGAYELKRRLGFELDWNTQIAFDGTNSLFSLIGRIAARM